MDANNLIAGPQIIEQEVSAIPTIIWEKYADLAEKIGEKVLLTQDQVRQKATIVFCNEVKKTDGSFVQGEEKVQKFLDTWRKKVIR